MSFSTVLSAAIQGLRVEIIHVEADVSNGLPMFHMVGYLSSEVKEASERGRTDPQFGFPVTCEEDGRQSGSGYSQEEGRVL